jgi:hypothetical protein
MTRKWCFCAISLFISITILPSLHASAAQIDADPLISYESHNDEYTFHGLGPIFEFSDHISAIRPFYFKDKDTSETDIIYPLGQFTPERSRFTPLYTSVDQEDQKHTDLFPVFYGSYKDTSYWGIFPLYGTMEHRFGYTKARFILLPLYAQTTLDDENSTYSFLWPIFSYSKGRLYRVFPLYEWKKSTDATYQFFLWPLIHHKTGPGDKRMDAFLPLFRYDRGPHYQNISILWPFFNYNRDDASHHVSIDFPWPLIRTASGAYEEIKVFPLYWTKTEGNAYSGKTILWPVWSSASWHYEDTGIDQKNITILLTNRLTTKTTQDGQISRRLYLWPFYYSSQDGAGSEWHFPAIFPLFFDEGFSRTWGPVLSIAESTTNGESSETSILWRIITWSKTGQTSKWSFSLLASSTKTSEYRQWGFLGNLIRIKQDTLFDTPDKGNERD